MSIFDFIKRLAAPSTPIPQPRQPVECNLSNDERRGYGFMAFEARNYADKAKIIQGHKRFLYRSNIIYIDEARIRLKNN